jgi:gliding motility-associated-like protein
MKTNIFYFITFLLFFCRPISSKAQVTITNSHPASSMAQMLAGVGVSVSNAFYNGTCDSSSQSGKFFATSPTLFGLDSGIILTSGQSSLAVGPSAVPSVSLNNAGDADLSILCSPQLSHDACILEFDFVPVGDTIKFKYVFASAEYQTFSCSIADVFGFFISGPGITGTFSNSSTNIALLPNGCYVGVNTVNGQTSNPCGNASGACAPPNNALFFSNLPIGNIATGIAYNGYTLPMYAVAVVNPCATYHLKLAIADASDWILDSGVFLEAGSLSSNNLSLGFNTGFGVVNPFIVEGCDSLVIKVRRNLTGATTAFADTVGIIVGGNATMLPDYTSIPTQVYFTTSIFDTVKTIVVYPILDGITEGVELITIKLLNGCNGSLADSITVQIKDSLSFQFANTNTQICAGQTITTIGAGYSGTIFSWSPSANVLNPSDINTVISPPVGTTTYFITGTYLGCPAETKYFTVIADPLPILGFPASYPICYGKTVQLQAVIPPVAGISYSWSPFNTLSCAFCPFPIAAPLTTTDYIITATSANGCVNKDTIRVKVIPLIVDIISIKDSTCIGDPINLIASVSGAGATWVMNFGDGTSANNLGTNIHNYNPNGIYQVILIAQDTLGCKDTVIKNVFVDAENYGSFTLSDSVICLGDFIAITDSINANISKWIYKMEEGYIVNSLHNPIVNYSKAGSYVITLTTKSPFCVDNVFTRNVIVNDYPAVNLGPDATFCPGLTAQFNLENLSTGSGSYLWSNGSTNNKLSVSEAGKYYVTITANNCSTSDTINIDRDCYINVPNAFTPDDDGLNNYFLPANQLTSGLTSFSMRIFNRFGNEVFYTTRLDSRGWDGKLGGLPQPIGTYVYQITATLKNGERKNMTGNFTLLR